ncbi:MAG: Maf family protein [Planctomycetia bacterium]
MEKTIVLGSGSPARHKLLKNLIPQFIVVKPTVEEPTSGFECPRSQVAWTSWIKAHDVSSKVTSSVIICADTIGWMDKKPLMKPENREHAFQMLRSMSGKTHELWTGVVLWDVDSGNQLCWQEQSLVEFRNVTDPELENYLETRSWKEHSGAYSIEESNDPWVTLKKGSLTNVIGLPMESLRNNLSKFCNDIHQLQH